MLPNETMPMPDLAKVVSSQTVTTQTYDNGKVVEIIRLVGKNFDTFEDAYKDLNDKLNDASIKYLNINQDYFSGVTSYMYDADIEKEIKND